MTKGLEDFMLECTNKKIFGVECMGCGIQRATALLFQGEFVAAFKMYPAIYSLFLLAAVVMVNFFIKFRYDYQIKIGLLIFNVAVIVISYIIKMSPYIG